MGAPKFCSNQEVEMTVREPLSMQGVLSTGTAFLNSREDDTKTQMCSGIILKNNEASVKQMSHT